MRPIDTRPAELDQFVREWTEGMLGGAPLTDAERGAVTDAVRRSYEDAGLPWPGRVVWAPSPTAGRLLAADLARRHTPATTRIGAVATVLRNAAGPTIGGALAYGCAAALYCAIVALALLLTLPGDAVAPGDPDATFAPAHWRGLWIGGIVGGLLLVPVLVWLLAEGMPTGVVGSLGHGVLIGGVVAVFGPGLLASIFGWCAGLGVSALVGGAGRPSAGWVTALLTATLIPTVAVATVTGIVIKWRSAPPAPLRCVDPAYDRLDRCLVAALTAAGAAAPAVPGPHTQVRDAVDESIVSVDRSSGELVGDPGRRPAGQLPDLRHDLVDLAAPGATRRERRRIRRYPVGHFGVRRRGALAEAVWLATRGAPVPADADQCVRGFAAASGAGWWWPHTRFVVISERPSAPRLDHR